MWQWIDPGATQQPCGKFLAGQTTGSCEYAYAFLSSTTLSGDKRNLPAERKPQRVNETYTVMLQIPHVAMRHS